MVNFLVRGPYKVHFEPDKGGKAITRENIAKFWEDNQKRQQQRGCYVFAIRAGKGFTPGYVGRATKSFKQEVFQGHKHAKYQQILSQYAKGTPVLFFVIEASKRGKPNVSQIKKVEDYLINLGAVANPKLMNVKGTKRPKWGIKGVIRGGKGKTGGAAKDFRVMMGIAQ